ncbi:MAG: 2-oxoacid:acceptor oxidoreductase family protein [Candidatus Omnitrophica bacterium]|nr:2-oxoacid:acceptor oxidoreductase family protein [Candidatus Omnitrophota bacterium]
MSKVINILFCGTGGQGVLKAAEVTGVAAMCAGFHVKKSEVHGMAQRGGSVESHLRFGQQVFSPLVPKGGADILLPFHSGEEERLRGFLKPGGLNLLPFLGRAHEKGVERMFLNTYMVGVLAGHLELGREFWMQALEQEFRAKKLAENINVFLAGFGEVGA